MLFNSPQRLTVLILLVSLEDYLLTIKFFIFRSLVDILLVFFVWAVILLILMVSGVARADAIVGFEATIVGIPEFREDGTPLNRSEIKAFRVFKVGATGLEALTPDITYNQEDEVEGVVFAGVAEPAGSLDLCAMTIDTFDQISTICSDVVSVTFKVSPPSAPGTSTFTQSVTFNITVGN